MEGPRHRVDLVKDRLALKEKKPVSILLLTFFAADFLHSSDSERAGMVVGRNCHKDCDVAFSTKQRFGVFCLVYS